MKVKVAGARGKADTFVECDEEGGNVWYFFSTRDSFAVLQLNIEKLRAVKAAFVDNGTVTAPNSSPLSDGAAALVLISGSRAKELGIKVIARVCGYADAAKVVIGRFLYFSIRFVLSLSNPWFYLGACWVKVAFINLSRILNGSPWLPPWLFQKQWPKQVGPDLIRICWRFRPQNERRGLFWNQRSICCRGVGKHERIELGCWSGECFWWGCGYGTPTRMVCVFWGLAPSFSAVLYFLFANMESSGARIIATLISVLKHKKARVGCAGVCNGGGGASSVVIEMLENAWGEELRWSQ